MTGSLEDRRIRSLRPPKPSHDPWAPQGVLLELERHARGVERALTVFLTGAECPFTCVFCDLWQHTLEGPTPPGVLPAQLRAALASHPGPIDRIKLYNASNFFEPRAVPGSDLDALGTLVDTVPAVTVESHARTIGPRTLEFAARIRSRLEVAIGLETIHPVALTRLNKGMSLDDFDRAATFLRRHDIGLRVFVLLGAPFVPPAESVDWAVQSVARALALGAALVSIIPVRGGNGAMEALAAAGDFRPPRVAELERALEASQQLGGIVTADLWDLDRLAGCAECRGARIDRLRLMNLGDSPGPAISCECEGRDD